MLDPAPCREPCDAACAAGALARPARRLVVAVVGALLVTMAGCSTDTGSIADQARNGDSKGYLAGDGSIERVGPDRRGAVVPLSGKTLEGRDWSLAGAAGKVVVVNVWGSWCAPCEAEMPHLQSLWSQLVKQKQPVQFVGVNVRESAATAAAAARRYGLTYPSLVDDGGRVILALQGKANYTPTTLVLDRSGRIAARVSGPVTSPATLRALVSDVLREQAGAAASTDPRAL